MAEDDFEFEPDEAPQTQTARGFVVNKSTLAKWSGLSPMTVDKLLADGGPIISKGSRKQGWQINTADFFGWYVRRKVEEVTDDPESGSFDVAKRRDKESQTRLRDLQIAKLEGELVPIVDVERWAAEKYGVTRSRFLAVESQVPGLSDEQRDLLRAALVDALADLSGYTVEPAPDDDSLEEDDDSLEEDEVEGA
jgi:phage terminase Nu1 subunit (DNA packaging protein)